MVDVGGVRLHVREAGAGPLVLLLHGFPETGYGWRRQIPALAEAGFRVAAPDLRGYGLSDRPTGIRPYRAEALCEDVAGLVRALGEERAAIVGHDWGGLIAWYLTALHPRVIDRLVVVNAPHPRAFRRELKTPDQARRSWYAGFFQLPLLPEAALRAGDFALMRHVFRTGPRRKGAYTEEDVAVYREAWSRPGALTAMVNYYRAIPRHRPPRMETVRAPTLLLWGMRDPHLRPQLSEGLEEWVPDLRVVRLQDASHWVPADAPDVVNERITGFLRER